MVLFARDILEKEFLTRERSITVLEAAKLMRDNKRGFIIVVSGEGVPEGMVTEWDFLSKVVAEERDPASVTLGDIMSADLVTVNPNDGTDSVARLMAEKGIRRVLVVQDGKILGIITSKTVLSRLKEYVDTISSQIARLQGPLI